MRTTFFAINFTGGILFTAMCVLAVSAAESPFSFLGGICFFPLTAGFAIAEWVAWYRRNTQVERILGGICIGICGFCVFGVLANVAEALQSPWPDGFEWLVVIGLAIALYFGICGVSRCWRRKTPHPLDAAGG